MKPLTKSTPVVSHFRYDAKGHITYKTDSLSPYGGLTVIFFPTTKLFVTALCSKTDRFNRKLGTRIAMQRHESLTGGDPMLTSKVSGFMSYVHLLGVDRIVRDKYHTLPYVYNNYRGDMTMEAVREQAMEIAHMIM